ncbi:hypothetical protein GCM10027055_11370 [Janibacter alkaliphilus]|uniref:Uncharacterized protein n=1 Tax=Janibacter alkaliphilus TaxID=1069963 RepID=A0A852X4N4_9MICO|nr:hypothetical protein [Janibacter alkaliphilus]NYG37869.1 hypothetical protein [Janibacter alkaliphilus]
MAEEQEALAEILELVGRLDARALQEQLPPGVGDQLVAGLSLVAEAVTRAVAQSALADPLDVELDAPEGLDASRRRRQGVRITVHDDDASSEDVTGT